MNTLYVCEWNPNGTNDVLIVDEVCDGAGNLNSYQRIGQHGACSPELLTDLEPATPEEFAALHRELTVQVGYTLEVV